MAWEVKLNPLYKWRRVGIAGAWTAYLSFRLKKASLHAPCLKRVLSLYQRPASDLSEGDTTHLAGKIEASSSPSVQSRRHPPQECIYGIELFVDRI